MGLYTPTILGGNSYLSWFYDRGAIQDPAHTGTSKGLSKALNGGQIRKFLPKYANVYVTIQSHGLSAGALTHYVTANGARNELGDNLSGIVVWKTNEKPFPFYSLHLVDLLIYVVADLRLLPRKPKKKKLKW